MKMQNVCSYYVAPGLECTFNDVSGFPSSSGTCNEWPSKNKYSTIAVGYDRTGAGPYSDGSGFRSFYIDLPNDILSRPNQNVEGGIRPPLLTQVYFIFENWPIDVRISLQWDIMLYTIDGPGPWFYTSNPVICPQAPSRFWMSIYNNNTGANTTIPFSRFYIYSEESGDDQVWAWEEFCLRSGSLTTSTYANNADCGPFTGKEVGHDASSPMIVGGDSDYNLIVFKPAACIRRLSNLWISAGRYGWDSGGAELVQGMFSDLYMFA